MSATTASTAPVPTIGVLGGTGKLGRGLALRWARAGVPVVLGSRDAQRAAAAADQVRDALGHDAPVTGAGNVEAAALELVVAAVPAAGATELIGGLAEPLAGKVLLSAISPLRFDDDGPAPDPAPDGTSAAEALASAAPQATVVAGLHTVSSAVLGDLDHDVAEDTLLCGDDDEALERARSALTAIDGLRPVTVGPLRLARTLEGLTAVLIATNRRHRVHAGVQVTGLG